LRLTAPPKIVVIDATGCNPPKIKKNSYRYSYSVTLTSYLSVESDADATLAIVGRHGDLSSTPRAVGVSQGLVIAWSRIVIIVVSIVTYFWVLQTTDRWLCRFVTMADYITSCCMLAIGLGLCLMQDTGRLGIGFK
jgi:hypothetical protein